MKYDKNNIKVIKFAEFYVETGNALDSARRAGFDNPMAAAKELRKKTPSTRTYKRILCQRTESKNNE